MSILLSQLFENYHTLENQKILMFYKGAVSQETMVDLGSFLRSSLCGSNRIRNIFSVFIEMSHNIRHHSAERDDGDVGIGMFMIEQADEYYTLSSGNTVPLSIKDDLDEKLKHLVTLDRDGVRQFYKERRRSGENRTTKGAGLGLIEMAKKADLPLEWEFFDCNNECALFRLTVKILKGE